MIKKIILGILILMVVAIVTMVILMKSVNNQKASNEKVLQSESTDNKKVLLIFQPSVSDVTSLMANSIAKGLNDEGYEVTINYPGDYLSTDISKYSFVIFGSPVYAGQPLSILTNYMSKIKDYSHSKVILFSTGSDSIKQDELNIMEESLSGTKAYKKVKFAGEKQESENKAYDLGKGLANE